MERFAWPEYLSSSRKHAIQELLHGQNPTKKLRHLLDAHSQTGNDTGQPLFAEDLIVNALRSFSNTLSLSSSSESYEVLQVPTNACVRSEVSEGSESINTPVPRKTLDTWTRLDQNLMDDGQQWRTCDQKLILNSKLPPGHLAGKNCRNELSETTVSKGPVDQATLHHSPRLRGKDDTLGSSSAKTPKPPLMLLDAISKEVAAKDMNTINANYELYRTKRISRDDFIKRLRSIVGDELLWSIIRSLEGKLTLGSRHNSKVPKPEQEV
ncbi:uncharacterized protein LOC115677040 isoform X2 [Syzygium oleosum]|uniref:uncharacterized protein LOC115677040 isoform X2 n=1 Tax=Syzygium oleosum TaxID=219896 RepID=UPI0024BBC3D4|nr:uncharacterized protein LOC115677040 isoform X2 [Syzygium oleosum]